MRISARNVLEGTIKEVRKGATTAHIVIELRSGDVMTSSVANEAVDALGLAEGIKVFAVIKASDVMVALQ
ncbi:MAG TPA: TOBE domain-containing protein [Methylocella sp.]|nr:TOBE domain-containing protein [Methylocella sp.]